MQKYFNMMIPPLPPKEITFTRVYFSDRAHKKNSKGGESDLAVLSNVNFVRRKSLFSNHFSDRPDSMEIRWSPWRRRTHFGAHFLPERAAQVSWSRTRGSSALATRSFRRGGISWRRPGSPYRSNQQPPPNRLPTPKQI